MASMMGIWAVDRWLLESSSSRDIHDGCWRAWVSHPDRTIVGYATAPDRDDALRAALANARQRLPGESAAIDRLEGACFNPVR